MPARTHGQSSTKLYKVWSSMKQRCLNPNDVSYRLYGGRGVTVCPGWMDFEPFRSWAISSGYSEGLTLERIDIYGDYSPENCEWIPKPDQSSNTRRNKLIRHNGRTMSLKDWADEIGISYRLLQARVTKYGWDHERALTAPITPANRCHVVMIEHRGISMNIAEWARELGVSYGTLYNRLYRSNCPRDVIDDLQKTQQAAATGKPVFVAPKGNERDGD